MRLASRGLATPAIKFAINIKAFYTRKFQVFPVFLDISKQIHINLSFSYCEMTTPLEVCIKQRAIIEFLKKAVKDSSAHLSYTPDLAPGYHFFVAMKNALKGKRYGHNEEVKIAVNNWLRKQPTEFYKTGIQTLIQMWNTAIERDGDYVDKEQCELLTRNLILIYGLFCGVLYF